MAKHSFRRGSQKLFPTIRAAAFHDEQPNVAVIPGDMPFRANASVALTVNKHDDLGGHLISPFMDYGAHRAISAFAPLHLIYRNDVASKVVNFGRGTPTWTVFLPSAGPEHY